MNKMQTIVIKMVDGQTITKTDSKLDIGLLLDKIDKRRFVLVKDNLKINTDHIYSIKILDENGKVENETDKDAQLTVLVNSLVNAGEAIEKLYPNIKIDLVIGKRDA